jgi:hypothetical protein
MTPDVPLSLPELLPALEVLALKDKYIEKLNEVLGGAGLPQGLFPVQLHVPLLLGVHAVVTFQRFNRDPVPLSVFEVPADYDWLGERDADNDSDDAEIIS